MGALADSIRNGLEATRGCKFSRIYATLDSDDQTAIDTAAETIRSGTRQMSWPTLRAYLAKAGHDVDHDGIRAHYAGTCPCRS